MIHPVNIAGMKSWISDVDIPEWSGVGEFPSLAYSWGGDFSPIPTYSYINGQHIMSSGGGGRTGAASGGYAHGLINIQDFEFSARVFSRPDNFDVLGLFIYNPTPINYSGVGVKCVHRGVTYPYIITSRHTADNVPWNSNNYSNINDPLSTIQYIKISFVKNSGTWTTSYSQDGVIWNTHIVAAFKDGYQTWGVGGKFAVGLFCDTNGNQVIFDQVTLTT